MSRNINTAGLQLIKKFEGLRLVCYDDSVGIATIGYGHTRTVTTADIGRRRITEAQAEALLKDDLDSSERAVERYVSVALNDNQFSALVSFTFNLGAGSLKTSTLLQKLNQGDYDSVPAQLARWVKAGGRTLAGLVKRRLAEGELFTMAVGETDVDDFTSPRRLDQPDAEPSVLLRSYLTDSSVQLERGSVDDIGSAKYIHLNQNVPDGYVLALQNDLLALGFDKVSADGAFGANTRKALQSFQKLAKINTSGILDDSSRDAIILWLQQGYSKTSLPSTRQPDDYLPGVKRLITPAVAHFSQGDPRWGSRLLGRSSSISKQGCAISCIAMILRFYGRDASPGSLDAYLDTHGGYSGNSVLWNIAGQFGASASNKLKYHHKTGKNKELIKLVKQRIKQNKPTMARVDYGQDRDLTYNHFVLCVGISAAGDIIMNDPATRLGNAYENSGNDNIIQKTSRKSGYKIVALDYYEPLE